MSVCKLIRIESGFKNFSKSLQYKCMESRVYISKKYTLTPGGGGLGETITKLNFKKASLFILFDTFYPKLHLFFSKNNLFTV